MRELVSLRIKFTRLSSQGHICSSESDGLLLRSVHFLIRGEALFEVSVTSLVVRGIEDPESCVFGQYRIDPLDVGHYNLLEQVRKAHYYNEISQT